MIHDYEKPELAAKVSVLLERFNAAMEAHAVQHATLSVEKENALRQITFRINALDAAGDGVIADAIREARQMRRDAGVTLVELYREGLDAETILYVEDALPGLTFASVADYLRALDRCIRDRHGLTAGASPRSA